MQTLTAEHEVIEMRSGGKLPDLLVVGGIPRAGTSLLRRILRSHPQVHIPPREHQGLRFYDLAVGLHVAGVYFNLIARSYPEYREQRGRTWRYLRHLIGHYPLKTPTTLDMIHEAYASALATPQTRYVGDKYPDYLLHYPRYVHRPDTRCIFTYRDPRDVVASMMVRVRHGAWRDKAWAAKLDSISRATRYWIAGMNCIADLQKLQTNAIIIRYEDFVADPAATMTVVADHLSVPADGFDWGESNTQSIGKYRETLTEEEVGTVERLAGDLMGRYEYL